MGDDHDADRVYFIEGADGEHIVETDGGFYPPQLADARLIALAPRMLQLLEEISVPESFPLWDADRRALLRQLEDTR